jgi:hypothetical protein
MNILINCKELVFGFSPTSNERFLDILLTQLRNLPIFVSPLESGKIARYIGAMLSSRFYTVC